MLAAEIVQQGKDARDSARVRQESIQQLSGQLGNLMQVLGQVLQLKLAQHNQKSDHQ
jgi:hypothetical protein